MLAIVGALSVSLCDGEEISVSIQFELRWKDDNQQCQLAGISHLST